MIVSKNVLYHVTEGVIYDHCVLVLDLLFFTNWPRLYFIKPQSSMIFFSLDVDTLFITSDLCEIFFKNNKIPLQICIGVTTPRSVTQRAMVIFLASPCLPSNTNDLSESTLPPGEPGTERAWCPHIWFS